MYYKLVSFFVGVVTLVALAVSFLQPSLFALHVMLLVPFIVFDWVYRLLNKESMWETSKFWVFIFVVIPMLLSAFASYSVATGQIVL